MNKKIWVNVMDNGGSYIKNQFLPEGVTPNNSISWVVDRMLVAIEKKKDCKIYVVPPIDQKGIETIREGIANLIGVYRAPATRYEKFTGIGVKTEYSFAVRTFMEYIHKTFRDVMQCSDPEKREHFANADIIICQNSYFDAFVRAIGELRAYNMGMLNKLYPKDKLLPTQAAGMMGISLNTHQILSWTIYDIIQTTLFDYCSPEMFAQHILGEFFPEAEWEFRNIVLTPTAIENVGYAEFQRLVDRSHRPDDYTQYATNMWTLDGLMEYSYVIDDECECVPPSIQHHPAYVNSPLLTYYDFTIMELVRWNHDGDCFEPYDMEDIDETLKYIADYIVDDPSSSKRRT